MTRAWFLGLIGLGAAGQRTVTTPIRPEDMASMYPGGSKRPKPRNGECPVCGTMAPAYRKRPIEQIRKEGMAEWYRKYAPNGGVMLTGELHFDPDPQTRTVSCAHCRVRFDQDTEEGK